ncbi:MAG TPA: hypothetical protein VF337_00960 [Candidatus Limnocylindrales bacterium]
MRRLVALVLIGAVAVSACGSASKTDAPGTSSAPAASDAAGSSQARVGLASATTASGGWDTASFTC